MGSREEKSENVINLDASYVGDGDAVDKAWTHFRNAQFQEAEQLCNTALKTRRFDSNAWSLHGLLEQRANRHLQAVKAFRVALAYGPDLHAVHYSLGVSLRLIGNAKAAITHLRMAIKQQPDIPNYQRELGMALFDTDQLDEAEYYLKQTLHDPQALHMVHIKLGLIFLARKNFNQSLEHFTQALHLSPNSREASIRKAELLIELDNFREALDVYHNLLKIDIDNPRLWSKCASLHFILGGLDQAARHVKRAISIEPGNVESHVLLGKILLSQGNVEQAEDVFNKALAMQPDDPHTEVAYAVMLERKGDSVEAARIVDEVLDLIPDHPQLLMLMARIQKSNDGRRKTIEYIDKRLRSGTRLPGDARAQLHFSSGSLLDRLGDSDAAFHHFQLGNTLRSNARKFDKDGLQLEFDAIEKIFSREFFKNAPKIDVYPSKKMIFVVGMPRSGTSLAEQILASHSGIYGAGEQLIFGRLIDRWFKPPYANKREHYERLIEDVNIKNLEKCGLNYIADLPKSAHDYEYIVDKMPYNFMHVGMLSLVFPNAKIIHCTRNPIDTALSCYFQDFAEGNAFSYDLLNCGWFYNRYSSLMNHWKNVIEIPICENNYESLVEYPEDNVIKLLDFCGLDFEPGCLDFHRSNRVVHTASYQQVREPIYRRSVEKWRRYKTYLGPLLDALDIDC